MKKHVLGIKIDDISLDQAVETVIGWLNKSGKRYIVTPNPEIIVMAQSDEKLKDILNKADLSIPDGVGLKLTTDIVCNTPGVDLMEALIKSSLDYGFTIGLLGGREEVAEKTADCLRKKYPGIKIVYTDSGGEIDRNGSVIARSGEGPSKRDKQSGKDRHASLASGAASLAMTKMDLLFVAFGPPKQEKWIAKNIKNVPVKVVMAVGGSFDYLSGIVPRAPLFIRKLGLEWLFRLIIQPWRIGRQLRLLKFLFLVLSQE